jgi:hypothetical protein
MIERNGRDLVIGWVPGPDEGNDAEGAGQRAMQACKDWAGWQGVPELGVYSYPSGGESEPWVWKSAGKGPVSIRAIAIPNGYDLEDMRAGRCDQIWRDRAKSIVFYGLGGQCRYYPGYEGNGNNFNGSAGIIGEAGWGEAVSRQLRVMAEIDGWDPWVGINFSAHTARRDGLDPEAAYASISEPFDSVDMDWYDTDDFSWQFPITDIASCIDYTLEVYEAQWAICQDYDLPLGFGEWGALWRSDGHGGGDRTEVLAAALDWIKAHDVAYLQYYNGTNMPGDNARVADYVKEEAAPYRYQDASEYPNVAPWVRANLDPADFVGSEPQPPSDLEQRVADLERWRLAVAEASTP